MTAFPRRLVRWAALGIGLSSVVAVACGGDDGGSAQIRTGSDEDYVEAFCEAQGEFFASFLAAAVDAGEDATEEEVLDAIKDPLKDARDAIRDARPPSDAVEYHRDLLAVFDQLVDAVEDGDVSALESDAFDIGTSALSEAVRGRLSDIAQTTEACAGFVGDPFAEES